MKDMYKLLLEHLEQPGTHSIHNLVNDLCDSTTASERRALVDAVYMAIRKGDALMVWQDGDLRFYATDNY